MCTADNRRHVWRINIPYLLTHLFIKMEIPEGQGFFMCFKKDGNSREEGGLDEIPSIYGYFLELHNINAEQQLFKMK